MCAVHVRCDDCENFYNLFQMVGTMTHNNDNTINIIFKCSDDKSEHEKIKVNSDHVNSCTGKWRIEGAQKVPPRLLVTGDRSGERRNQRPAS